MHLISQWNFARSPNYTTNDDLLYAYSEVPYIGNYKLVKIPIAKDMVEQIDYWGEGRINVSEGSTGFSGCYNVNHQYQLVSNGPDRDRKIPNRIPVISYINCDTSSYIKDDSVKLVTLMGAPINRSCAEDIARMVNADTGKVVVYGFPKNSRDVKNLEEELAKKKILCCDGYKLSDLLKSITLFDEADHRVYLNITDLSEQLYNKIIEGSYEEAKNICKILENNDNGSSIVDVVTRLLKDGKINIMIFTYKLWNSELQNLVSKYFPITFKLIYNQDYVKIISKKNLFTLRLDNFDSNNDKNIVGDGKDKESPKLRWKILPVVENETLYFKIVAADNGMVLTMEKGDTAISVKSSAESDAESQWFLDPIKVDDDMLFFIINRKFNKGLKLAEKSDERGLKQLIRHNGSVYEEPLRYGWYIAPW